MSGAWIAIGPMGALRRNEMDDTLPVKHCILLQARSVKNAFVLNHQYMHRYNTHTLSAMAFLSWLKWSFIVDTCTFTSHTRAHTYMWTGATGHTHTHTHRSLLQVPCSLKIIPWVFSSSGEGTHLCSALYWFKSIWSNLINTTILVPLMSVWQRTRGVWWSTAFFGRIHTFRGDWVNVFPWVMMCATSYLATSFVCCIDQKFIEWNEAG